MARELVITGTGRCGTMYAAQLLTNAGVPCGHESRYTTNGVMESGKPADVSWLAAPHIKDGIHIVRNPIKVISSMLRIRLFSSGDFCPSECRQYRDYAYKHMPGLDRIKGEAERATFFYLAWTKMCDKNTTSRVRIEDGPIELLNEVAKFGYELNDSVVEPSNGINHAAGFPASFSPSQLSPKLHSMLLERAREYGYNLNVAQDDARVFWAVLLERSVQDVAVNHLLNISAHAAHNNYQRIELPYSRADTARNDFARAFVNESANPDDTLVMLDNDHAHPANIVKVLAERQEGVVGALAFMRGPTPRPCFFVRDENGGLSHAVGWEEDRVYKCTLVGTGAIAIKRWVFDKLEASGFRWPWFRYEYHPGVAYSPTEDIYFGKICEKAGIPHHVHTGVITPHIGKKFIDDRTWAAYLEEKEK